MSRIETTMSHRTSGWGQHRARKLIGVSLAAAFLSVLPTWAQTVVRQPYLQLQTPTGMTIVWRTDTATDSRVRYGTVQGTLNQTASNPSVVTNHIVAITGLSPATKYFYDAGSTTTVQVAGTSEHYFVTSPTPGSAASFRAWIVGDSGDGGTAQAGVRDAMLAYTGASRPNIMLHVGDIAYTSGSEQEFTDFHFGIYKDIIRHTVQWPTLGNHEGSSTTSGQPGASTGPYYDAFVLPTAAEAGGTASGTEAYYSFDYGNVHFISLNAYQVSRSASGPMATWLQNDLAATNAQWVVAFWHHPPYSHGTHNSDSETELREMRENLVPILEAGGVDLVLCGHSHDYERSYLIDGTYSTPTPNFATLQAQGHILDDGDGKPTGTGAYEKGAGLNAHEGAVYVVAGHGGAAMGGTLDHPVMYFSEAVHGSCILDVNGTSLTLTNVRQSGVVSDTFTIQKGPQAPKVLSTSPTKSAVLAGLPTIRVTFSGNVTGVDAGDLTVNGSAATALSGAPGGSVYDFSGYAAPANGHVGVVLAAGGIADASNGSLLFTGNTWSYTIDTTPPRVLSESPGRGQAIGVLPSVTVNFSKGVTGVTAGSLQVNGQPATTLSGISGSTGPYTFTGFPAPSTGQVSVALLSGTIQDELSQPFAGDSWVYVLQPHLVINEYLTSNNSSAQDENGEFDDYVEIYNPASVAVDMSGMHLTDTLDFPAQYRIPDGVVIPSHGHLIFWCDSQPAQGTFHTNFNLARAGEAIGLFDTDENGFAEVDSTSWVNATTDVPVGRFPDGAPGYVNMPATAGATNTISCTTNPQCSALTDQCNTGVCTSNRCIAQSANQGAACDDGIACRAPDTCNAGVCDGGPSLCTGGQTCNLVTGLCEVPAANPLPIGVGAPWKYFKGTVAPPTDWNQIAFDDSSWTSGNSGFGYGTDCSTEHGTVLSDMLNGYTSLYVRRLFRVDNPAAIQSMTAMVDYDDGFVMYINGHEVARSNVVGAPPSNTQLATADHECSSCNTPPCNAPGSFTIDLSAAQLVAGNNVIAIQAHNLTSGSSDFSLIPSLVATEGQGCAVNPECDDNNACTDDACAAGVCQHTNADGNTCSDGIACTNDACSSGVCVSTSACPVGRTCNLGNGLCESTPVTVTFQQGASSYVSTVDTFVHAGSPTTDNGAAVTLITDGPTVAVPGDERQVLLRFDALFTSQGGPIPDGAAISSATLQLNITNPSADGAELHRMLVPWTASSTWNSLTNGVQRDGVESVAAADVSSLFNGTTPALHAINVTSSLTAWSAGGVKQGWVMVTPPPGSDSWQFDSSEGATVANRPKLSVTYTFSPPCSVDADCTDNNVCNGIETCVATVCQTGTALTCNDGNGCTTDSCNPASGCVFSNNANPCSDGDACTANDTCSGGSCVPGAAANCNDGNACTDDSCNSLTGCVHANNTASCSDGNLCTTGDVCSGGTCGGTPVGCPIGQTCNSGTGTCQSGPTTLTFQQGASGYVGSVDTYIDTALGSQAGVSPIVIDGSPVEQALLRFDGIFGSGPNQIPSGSTVSSATLTLWVGANTSDESANAVNFHRLLHAWNAADVWAAFGVAPWNASGGIQNDDVDAVSAVAATVTMPTVATSAAINVTTSVQAWAASPSSNFGWAILSTGTDGLRLESAESTTSSNTRRPLLSVTFNPPVTGCVTNADCNDNNACNGTETCVTGTCQAGTAPNCDDGNVCTTDSCVPASGCAHANNTVACTDGNACTANDTCAGGTCVSGAAANCDDANPCTNDSCNTGTGCVHANNTSSCSDGSLCTTGDVCSGGSCSGTPVGCPVGQACNPTNGSCEASANPPLPIVVGDAWRYFKGTVEPAPPPNPPAWAAIAFDDSGWLTGPSGFGYGPDGCMAQVGTTVSDMQNPPNTPGYFSIYARRKFNIINPATVSSLTAVIDYDDSVVVYVNGTEVGRSTSMGGTVGTPTAFNTAAASGHECSVCDSPPCNPAQSFTINPSVLVAGTNVIAIHAHNQTLASSDFILIPTVSATTTGCTTNADCGDNDACNGLETCVTGACQAGTAPNCDDGNVCTTDSCVPASGCAHANNTVSCSDGNACTSNDTCAGGTCVGGVAPNCDDANPCTDDSCNTGTGCVHANNTSSCSDSNLCTTGDVCSGGTCSGTPVGCPVGQTCNPTSGACEASANPPLPIVVGDTWRYFKGTVEPAPPPSPPTWATIGFDDSGWLTGPSGFGYGPDGCMAQVGTTVSDMQNPPNTPGYFSIYARRKFNIVNPAAVSSITAVVDYDDSVVVYVNGTEVGRSTSMGGTSGTPTAFNTPAASGHECSVCDTPPCNPAQSFAINPSVLVAGTNVIAIHAHNQSLTSSDFILIPTVSATIASCSVNADCNDSVACTNDTCVTGACVHTSNCLAGQTCNLGTGSCESTPVSVTFQQGVGGYAQTVDTFVNSNAAQQSANNAAVTPLVIDGDPDIEQALVRFDGIFGNGAGQIPLGATIQSATLTVNVTNASLDGMALHRMLQPWTATSSWSSLVGGISANDTEAVAAADVSTTYNSTVPASFNISVTNSVAAWSAGATNLGWAFLPNGTDSIQFDSADVATVSLRPKLTVIYVSGCSTNAQCDDGNACNGVETCVTGQCQAGTPLNCTDNNPCTTDSCDAGTGCHFVNNTAPCNDGQTCTTGDVCSGGSCVGTPASCDDGVACTADTCLEGSGCQHASNCAGGGTCNLQSGVCTAARMECSPSTIAAGSGSTANLIVILRNLGGLAPVRGYQTQVSIARTSGTGTVSVSCPGGVAIDDARSDYLYFNSANDFPATNCAMRRAESSLLSGGVTVGPTPAYLAGYTLTTSPDATAGSTFSISLDTPPASSLVGSGGLAIDFDRGPSCTLTIASCVTAAECDDGNPCTVDTCDLSLGCQHTPGNAGTVCRPAAGPCDPAETCTGASATCPADLTSPNGTACNDGNGCTQTDTCQGGTCVGSNPLTCNDSNVCTDDSCSAPAGTCVHVASGVCGIDGTVYYYRDDTGNGGLGSEPSAKPVPNVGVDRTADAVADATTGGTGTYAFSSVFGNVTVATVPKFGSPRASDHNGGISSFDASVVARAAALLVTLSPNQQIAGDVTGDGTVSSFDASFVARFAAGLIDHFDVAVTTGSDWKFRRCDAYAFPGDPGCGAPSYAFTPIAQAETGKNFYAILYGDVTGNWQPSAPFTAASPATSREEQDALAQDRLKAEQFRRATPPPEARRTDDGPAEMSLTGWTSPLRAGERREVTFDLRNADGILGLDLVLNYDPSRISIAGIRTAGIAQDFVLARGGPAGASRVAAYGVVPLSGSGPVLTITVEALTNVGSKAPLTFAGVANEGKIPLRGSGVVRRPTTIR